MIGTLVVMAAGGLLFSLAITSFLQGNASLWDVVILFASIVLLINGFSNARRWGKKQA